MEPRHESLDRFHIQAMVAHGRPNRHRMVGISSQVNADVCIPYPLVSEQVVADCLAARLLRKVEERLGLPVEADDIPVPLPRCLNNVPAEEPTRPSHEELQGLQ